MRTAHGTADVAVDVRDAAASLQQLIADVTGQAAPNAASIDGRPVDATLSIGACGLRAGSIVETDIGAPGPLAGPFAGGVAAGVASGVTLLQLTGPGAGITRRLETGRFVIGPGRRVNAEELEAAPVDLGAFEIDVRDLRTVFVQPLGDQQLILDGQRIVEPVEWSTGLLQADGRVFALEHSTWTDSNQLHDAARALDDQVDGDGRVVYNRPPGHIDDKSLLVADAVNDAIHVRPRLWHRPDGRNPPLTIDVGITPTTRARATVDLTTDRVIGVIGDAKTASALARAMLIDAVTSAGPSDLDVVIATTPDQLGAWDWAKWLPHVRNGRRPALLSSELEIALFASERSAPNDRRCLLIVTHEQWWYSEETPLRQLVLHGPGDTTIVTLSESTAAAPSSCDSLIELGAVERSPGYGRLVRLARGGARLELLVPLPSMSTALEVARSLARLRDPDLPKPHAESEPTGPATLAQFVGFAPSGPELPAPGAVPSETRREGGVDWDGDRDASSTLLPTLLPIGRRANETISIDLGVDRSVVISGSTIQEAVDLTRTLALSVVTAWPPDALSIVAVDHGARDAQDPIGRLPHHAGTFSDRGRAAGRRFTDRLRHKISSEDHTGRRLVVVVADPVETELASPGVIEDLLVLASASERMHLVIATDVPIASLETSLRSACAIEVTVDRVGAQRRAAVNDRSRELLRPFTPFEPLVRAEDGLVVTPLVYGRPLTTLERRLERRAARERDVDGRSRVVELLVDDIVALAERTGRSVAETLVPPPLPDDVNAEQFLAEHPGDGVPLGLIDRPDLGEPEVYWWQPGLDGSRLFVGSPRSGIRSAVDMLVRGTIERFSADDLHLYAIEQNDARRASLARVAHVGAAVAPDHADSETMLHMLLGELDRRQRASVRPVDVPAIVLLARNVERLSPAAIDNIRVLVTGGAQVGIFVAATASRLTTLSDFVADFDHLIVGGLTDDADYARFGIDDASSLHRHPGRCVQVPTQRLVQLASSTRSFASTLNDVTTEPATARPPQRLTTPEAEQR